LNKQLKTIRLYASAAIFLVCLLAAPSSAFAAKGYGFFLCGVEKDGVFIAVHTKPALYDYPAPPAPEDDSIASIVKHRFAETAAFRDAHTDDIERFLTNIEQHYGESCRIDGYIYSHGPHETYEGALEDLNLSKWAPRMSAESGGLEFRVEILEFE
jgi:hypothetical protein